ncbi:MAG: aminotransferase class IV [Myxococcales bacterium]|nr:aminotransferase class IV [Myxococcales bacterium]
MFETLLARDGQLVQLELHLERLRHSCRAALIDCPPRELLILEMQRVVARVATTARVRITLTGSGRRIVSAEPIDPRDRWRIPVRAVSGVHHDEPVLGGGVKHSSRIGWMVALRRSGAEEVLLVDANGRFTEATSAAIIAVVDGVLYTAPADGRILASTSCTAIVERARELGIGVVYAGASASGGWDALYLASSTRGLAPVCELDAVPLPIWDRVGRLLIDAEPANTNRF